MPRTDQRQQRAQSYLLLTERWVRRGSMGGVPLRVEEKRLAVSVLMTLRQHDWRAFFRFRAAVSFESE